MRNKQTGKSLKRNIQITSVECINSGFLKFLSEYEKAFKFHSWFVASAPKFTLIDAR